MVTNFEKPISTEIEEINGKLPKKTSEKTYTIPEGTTVGDHSERNAGNAKTFFGLSNSDTILGVFVSNVASSFGSTFNYYIVGDDLYLRIDHSFTAGANANVKFYALYS